MATCKSMLSQRGQKLLIVENFKFWKAHESKCGKTRWRCVNKKCPAKVFTMKTDENTIIEVDGKHVHESSKIIPREVTSNSVKRKAIEDISEKPSKLICKEININRENLDATDIECIRRNMYTARRKVFPTLPKNKLDVLSAVRDMDLKTVKYEDFRLCIDNDSQIMIFSTYTNLRFLTSCEVLYMDGTFQYCASFYYQMFTIHGLKNGFFIPLVYALLPDKQTVTYEKLFNLLEQKCQTFNIVLSPSEVVVDFEKAIYNACIKMWPHIKIVGCRFHLAQSWFRKIQELGLTAEYKTKDSKIGQYLKLYFGVHLLDPIDAVEFFNTELHYLIPPNDIRITQFRNYLENNYFSPSSVFPVTMWCSQQNILYRTTNACESFHSKFNACFYTSHPNIFYFTKILLNFQIETYAKMTSCNKNSFKKQKKEMREKIYFVTKKIDEYNATVISRFSFVKSICFKYAPK